MWFFILVKISSSTSLRFCATSFWFVIMATSYVMDCCSGLFYQTISLDPMVKMSKIVFVIWIAVMQFCSIKIDNICLFSVQFVLPWYIFYIFCTLMKSETQLRLSSNNRHQIRGHTWQLSVWQLFAAYAFQMTADPSVWWTMLIWQRNPEDVIALDDFKYLSKTSLNNISPRIFKVHMFSFERELYSTVPPPPRPTKVGEISEALK